MCSDIKTKEISSPWKGGLLCLLSQIIYASHTMRPFESPKQDVLCFDMRENVWFSLFSSSRPHKILIELRLPGPISASVSGAKNAYPCFFFLILSSVGTVGRSYSGCKPRALCRGHETLPYPSAVSLFLTLLYHVSPLAILLFFCSARRIFRDTLG